MSGDVTFSAPPLKETAAAVLAEAAQMLSEGFTGRLVIHARDGEVQVFEAIEHLDGRALLKRHGRNRPAAHNRRTPGS